MASPGRFNTIHCDLHCPLCNAKILTGIGFRIGSLENKQYKIGDKINWSKQPTRPEKRPANGNVITLGHFNCDNPRCSSWQDCYPNIQNAKITIKEDKIVDIAIYTGVDQEDFAILEPPQ